jgi:hypothetical protein
MEKGEIKAATVQELGLKFDDMLESAQKEVARNEGAKLAMLGASKKVGELVAHVDKDMDEGAFSDLDGPLAIAAAVKKYVIRACGVLDSGAVSAENHRLIGHGKILAFEQMISNMKKVHDLELDKVKQRREAAQEVASGAASNDRSRPVGSSPGKTLKEQRQQEAAPSAVPAKSNGGSPPVRLAPPAPQKRMAPKGATKKKTFKKKTVNKPVEKG